MNVSELRRARIEKYSHEFISHIEVKHDFVAQNGESLKSEKVVISILMAATCVILTSCGEGTYEEQAIACQRQCAKSDRGGELVRRKDAPNTRRPIINEHQCRCI